MRKSILGVEYEIKNIQGLKSIFLVWRIEQSLVFEKK